MSGCGRRADERHGVSARDVLGDDSAGVEGSAAHAFLRDAGRAFRGLRLRVLTEDTPPSLACKHLIESEFSRVTGIDVDWQLEPLERVFAKASMDVARGAGNHDLVYLDQSWIARFAPHLESMEPWMERPDLAYPHWDFEDILAPLLEKTATYGGRLIGIPYDITIFIAMYRRDIFDKLGLRPPEDLDAWLEVCREIDKAMAPRVRGTTAQWRVGHYALLCHMSIWLWSHGGSFFRRDGRAGVGDDRAREALAYMMELGKHMPPAVTTWDWHGESQSFARGEAGIYTSWAEFFPVYDDPKLSRIVGQAGAVPLPRERALRPAAECGFGETPGFSHQGGSCMAIPRHARNKEAAWLLLQWVTSADIAVRAGLMGSGASAIRASTFSDPRILARQGEIGPGTTRHFPVMRDAILNRMGTGPHHPEWPAVAMGPLPNELGRLVSGLQGVNETASGMARLLNRQIGA